MLPIMNYYGNHNLDFENNDHATLEYYTITELRKLPIPDDIIRMEQEAVQKQFPDGFLSVYDKMTEWCPISFPGTTDASQKIFNKNVVTLGPFSMRIVFAPEYIILPSGINERIDWYSPHNKEKVQAWRFFYKMIITHFGGDHALYVDEKVLDNYFPHEHKPKNTALNIFEQTLKKQYGTSKKTLFDYAHGKFPKYYIDTFPDIK